MERRSLPAAGLAVEDRAAGDARRPVLAGYAARYYRADDPGTEYRVKLPDGRELAERIMPGAFDRAAKDDDVRALFNHDPNALLGRTGAGTLRLYADAVGLRYEVDPPDTEVGRHVVELIRRGDLTGSSFGFVAERQAFPEHAGRRVRELHAVRLLDVGPVVYPAYGAASVGLRADDGGADAAAALDVAEGEEQRAVAEAAAAEARAAAEAEAARLEAEGRERFKVRVRVAADLAALGLPLPQ